jgi:cytochrome c oxidase assembly factor CtaG
VADLGALTPIALVAAAYAIGLARVGTVGTVGLHDRVVSRGRRGAGIAGIGALALALGPPLDGWATHDLAAHMIQHVVLLAIAPPLLIMGTVPAVLAHAAPDAARARLRRSVGRLAKTAERVPMITWAALAVAAQTAALGVWHIPAIYDAAVSHLALHATEHLTFLATGLAFWWTLAGARRRLPTAAAMVTIFLASLPGTLFGALMTLSTAPWYPAYASGSAAHALQDQQLAGVVMWAGGGMAYVAAGASLLVRWLRDLERTSPSRARLEPAP